MNWIEPHLDSHPLLGYVQVYVPAVGSVYFENYVIPESVC